MYTLGISAAPGALAACLVRDGVMLAAAEEGPFTRGERQDPAGELPFRAIEYCLREAGITLADVHHVAYAHSPAGVTAPRAAVAETPRERAVGEPSMPARDPLLPASAADAPRRLLAGAAPHVRFNDLAQNGAPRWHVVPRHLARAAGAFLPSPFERAAVLTLGGGAAGVTTSYALGDGPHVEPLGEARAPLALGALYDEAAAHLGFAPGSGAQAIMALAPFGRPRYLDALRQIVRAGADGQYTIAPHSLDALVGPARAPGAPIEQRHRDLARSLQAILEETALALAAWLHEETGAEDLCLAGEVALSPALNARLRDETPFQRVWAQPAALDDAGTALGAALLLDAHERGARGEARMEHTFLGPAYADDEVEAALREAGLPYRRVADIAAATAELLAQDKIVAWFQGRLAFGPHALGARALLASPLGADAPARLNRLAGREGFRPATPIVLADEADAWFVGADESPFALFDYDVRPECAEYIPAARHVDGTAAIQTVTRAQHPRAYDLIAAFARLTNVPLLASAPLQAPGDPLASAPRDAVAVFLATSVDALAIGPFLVERESGRAVEQ